MPDAQKKVILGFNGGWATDFGPSFVQQPQNGALLIPFLTSADNIFYELDGAPHKAGGSTRLNSTAIAGSPTVHGFFDAWFQGSTGTETQKRVAYAGTALYKEDLDGTWDSLNTGLDDDKEPHFTMFRDDVIVATTSNSDGPFTWNGSEGSMPQMGGSPPEFAFSTPHKNRLWAAGVAANPSRLYYSNDLDHEDWTGGGSIDIDPEDGDRITGIRSHKNELIVFKGPNRQSIHRITGSAPSGSDAFARTTFITGISAVNNNGITSIGDDLVFPSPRGIHSMAATAAFGDYVEAFLARPILSYYQDSLNHTVLNTTWGVNYSTRGVVLWTFARSGGAAKNVLLSYDYRFQPGRWASLGKQGSYLACHCLAILQTNRVHRLYAGTTTGFVERIFDVTSRSLASGTSYNAEAKWPFLNFGSSAHLKNAQVGFVSLNPKGSSTLTVGWTRDRNTEQTQSVNQDGGDTLG